MKRKNSVILYLKNASNGYKIRNLEHTTDRGVQFLYIFV